MECFLSGKLIKSGLIVSFMTLVSRVLGLVRDVVIANVLGTGLAADIFFFANKIPNFLRRLFAEGAFAQAFVPVLSEYHTNDADRGDDKLIQTRLLIAQVSGTLGVLVSIVTLIGVIASPILVMLFGFGWFIDWVVDGLDKHKFELASELLKITFPYLWFISLTALAGAVLNTLGKFAVAAFTPVLLNVVIITISILGQDWFATSGHVLAWGVFIGGLVQFLFQIPFLIQAGVLVKPKWAWHEKGVAKIRKLIIPALFGVSVTQINLLLDTLIASFLITGSISWLYYADRLLEFPLGLFGIGIATVILPSLSKLHAKESHHDFAQTLDWGVRVVSLFGWPALAGLVALAQPIIMVLFMRGEFSETDVQQVSFALFAYLSGLMSFMYIKILAPGYYARQDTKTPVSIAIKAMVANMIFNIILAPVFGYVGLALATALSATLNASLLYWGLKQLGIFNLSRASVFFLLKVILSSVIMFAVVSWYSPSFEQWLLLGNLDRIFQLVVSISIGAGVYFTSVFLLGIRLGDLKTK